MSLKLLNSLALQNPPKGMQSELMAGFMTHWIPCIFCNLTEGSASEAVWKQNTNWKIATRMENVSKWSTWRHPISIPRNFIAGLDENAVNYHLYGFSDTSTRAYTAVIYLALKLDLELLLTFLLPKQELLPSECRLFTNLSFYLLSFYSNWFLSCWKVHATSEMLYWLPSCAILDTCDKKGVKFKAICAQWSSGDLNKINVLSESYSHCVNHTNPIADILSKSLSLLRLSRNKLWCSRPDRLHESTSLQEEPDSSNIPKVFGWDEGKNNPI